MCELYTDHMLGHGSFGSVYLGLLKEPAGLLCAVKREAKSDKSLLNKEYNIMRECTRGATLVPGIPSVYLCWSDTEYYYMATSLLGPTVSSLHKMCNKSFTVATTVHIAVQLIRLLQYYHGRGYIHRDIKPSNLLVDYSLPHKTIYLIDFGFMKKYLGADGVHIPSKDGVPRVGTLRFMSPYCLQGKEVSRRDDMYSAGYVIMYLAQGELPWRNSDIEHVKRSKRHEYVYNIKRQLTNAKLTEGLRCHQCRKLQRGCSFQQIMCGYFDYLDKVAFAQDIAYNELVAQLEQCAVDHGCAEPVIWDWNKYYHVVALANHTT